MLKSLDVSFNSIQHLPEEIGSATSLVKYELLFIVAFPLSIYSLLVTLFL